MRISIGVRMRVRPRIRMKVRINIPRLRLPTSIGRMLRNVSIHRGRFPPLRPIEYCKSKLNGVPSFGTHLIPPIVKVSRTDLKWVRMSTWM